jgi:hypothetical protein
MQLNDWQRLSGLEELPKKILREVKEFKQSLPLDLSGNNTELIKQFQFDRIETVRQILEIFKKNGVEYK